MHILISGASIAGLSAAVSLSRRGHRVTVVERSPALRLGGSPVDVRGDALEVADELGILSRIRRSRVTFNGGFTFVDADNTPVAALPVSAMNDAPDDVEIRRESLVRILRDAVDATVDFRFGERIRSMAEVDDAVQVRLAGGSSHRVDLVVGADGLHSEVRRSAFGPEADYVHHLGMYVGLMRLDPSLGRKFEALTYTVPGRTALLSNYGDEAFGLFVFRSPELAYDHRDPAAHRRLTRQAFAHVSTWHVPMLLDAMDGSPDFYFDAVAQVRMPGWWRGRVVLIGDAAHCASFFSGRGTSLAMLGAAFLAQELPLGNGDLREPLRRFELRLRPYVDRGQASVAEAQEVLVPVSADAISARNDRLAGFLVDGSDMSA